MDKLPTIVQEVNRNLTDTVIAALNPQFHYYVCFDQLDLGFDPTDKAYRDRLIGLILVARDLKVRARQAGKQISILIFLREDIYQTLRFGKRGNGVGPKQLIEIQDERQIKWSVLALRTDFLDLKMWL